MKKLVDKNGFTWTSFNQLETRYSIQYRKNLKEVEKWSDNESIQKYVYEDNLAHQLETLARYFGMDDLFFVTEPNKHDLIGVMFLSNHATLNDYEQLLNYIENGRQYEDKPSDISEDFLNIEETIDIKNNINENILTVEYAIINPNYQGKGIGTMLYKTLKDNIDFFSEYDTPAIIQASIHNENIPSRKTVIKNGFKRIRPIIEDQPYSVYYCRIKNHEDIHSEEKI